MSLIPEFLTPFQVDLVRVEPTEVEDSGPFRVQSFWGFDSVPTSQKDWLCGNTVQVFEPMSGGKCRVWEVTTAIGVPYDTERAEYEGKVLPAFAVRDLSSAMQELGYGGEKWNMQGWPIVTYTLRHDASSIPVLLEHFRESGMDVEDVLSKR